MPQAIKTMLREFGLNDLPDGKKLVQEGRELSKSVKIGKTLFLQKYGASSEREYKERMKKAKVPMFHFQYGLSNFEMSARGLELIYKEACEHGHRIDRFGVCLDRVMGLPEEMRERMPRETGLKFDGPSEWAQIGQIVPIQPHLGDHIIGSPASLENLMCALSAGVTTVGNFSQYFTYEYPSWTDQVKRAENTIKALGVMAGLRDQGVMIHSNLDDGFPSQFYDRCSVIGWAMLEYYIINKVIGAKLTNCFGNLSQDPMTRMGYVAALDVIHEHNLVGSMIVGNTIGYTPDFDRNYGVALGYAINDYVMQMHTPTGHAINPLPVTESVRIPSPEENAMIQIFAGQVAKQAEKQYELTDFAKIERYRDLIIEKGRQFYNRVLDTFSDVIDIGDPLKLIYALKKVGAPNLEKYFAEGSGVDELGMRKPNIPTGMYDMVMEMTAFALKNVVITEETRNRFKDIKVLVACTDVHEGGKMLVNAVLRKAGANVIDLGCSVDTETLVSGIKKNSPDAVALSTYNGLALSYAEKMLELSKTEGLSTPIIMGGRLNEDGGNELPVDAVPGLHKMGIYTSDAVESLIDIIDKITKK